MMYLIDKSIERISRFFRFLLSKDFILNGKKDSLKTFGKLYFIIECKLNIEFTCSVAFI